MIDRSEHPDDYEIFFIFDPNIAHRAKFPLPYLDESSSRLQFNYLLSILSMDT